MTDQELNRITVGRSHRADGRGAAFLRDRGFLAERHRARTHLGRAFALRHVIQVIGELVRVLAARVNTHFGAVLAQLAQIFGADGKGIENRKGLLIPGKDADIVIFDDDIQIQTTIVNGKIIYRK